MNVPQHARRAAVKLHGLRVSRLWLVVLAAALLLTAHLGVLRYIFVYARLSAGVAVGVLVLLGINHVGLLGWLHAVIRHRRRP